MTKFKQVADEDMVKNAVGDEFDEMGLSVPSAFDA